MICLSTYTTFTSWYTDANISCYLSLNKILFWFFFKSLKRRNNSMLEFLIHMCYPFRRWLWIEGPPTGEGKENPTKYEMHAPLLWSELFENAGDLHITHLFKPFLWILFFYFFIIQLKKIQTKEKSGRFFFGFRQKNSFSWIFLGLDRVLSKGCLNPWQPSRRADSRMGSVILWVTALFLLMQRCLCITEQTNRGCLTWTSMKSDVCCETCLPGE